MTQDDHSSPDPIRNHHTNPAFRDFDVHMLLEDEEENYLIKIGTVFQRINGELTGETAYGRLVLKAHKYPTPKRYRNLQVKDVSNIAPPLDEWRPNA